MTASKRGPAAWARRWMGEPLDVEAAKAFRAWLVDTNANRLRIMFPLMVLVHLGHAYVFSAPAADPAGAPVDAAVTTWRDGVAMAHLGTLPFTLVLMALVWIPRTRTLRYAAALGAMLYLAHGAVCTSIDQLVVRNTTAYTGYAFGLAVVVALRPLEAGLVYAAGFTILTLGIRAIQGDQAALMSQVANGFSLSLVGAALSMLMHASRRRDFSQRRIIESQRKQLETVNQALAQRVNEQVAEIVKRADEVHRLNAQLQTQVRDRSKELSLALSRIASQRGHDGTLQKGSLLADRFEVGELLGRGGMGAVYGGVDRATGAKVAIKVIQAASARQLDALHRFLREVRTAASVDHPAVVRVIHVDVTDDGLLFQVQELIDGITLGKVLRKDARLAPPIAARVCAVLCEALAAAHDKTVVHRDVKPDNVMLTSSAPGLKLLDFGLAKLFEQVQQQSPDSVDGPALPDEGDVTNTGFVVGTPRYMAPEQVEGQAEIIDRADVYAVGVVLFRAVAGRAPFDGAAPAVRTVLEPPTLKAEGVVVAPVLKEIARACLAREPAQRPSAREVATALGRFADAEKAPPLHEVKWASLGVDADASDVDGAEDRGSRAGSGVDEATSSERRRIP